MQLFHGDCLDILPTLADKSVDAIICDPPYGTTACKWDSVIPFEPMWKELKRIIKPRGAVVLFGSQPFTSALVMSNVKWFRYEWVWNKNNSTDFMHARHKPLNKHENICVFSDGLVGAGAQNPMRYYPQDLKRYDKANKRKNIGRTKGDYADKLFNNYIQTFTNYPTSELRFAYDKHKLHPTQKPLALLEYLVKTYTNEGDTVLDFTFGSGTTGHACVNLDRNFIGIERDETYFNLATNRINTALEAMAQPRQQSILDV